MTKYDDMLAQVEALQEMYDKAAAEHERRLTALRELIQETKERDAGERRATDTP